LGNTVERLITAYQEGLLSLLQLRERMPELHKKSKAVEAELQALETGAMHHARYLQLVENLNTFRKKLHARAKTLDVRERQQILRLLVTLGTALAKTPCYGRGHNRALRG